MRIDLVLGPNGRIGPATHADAELLCHVRVGDLLPVDIRKPRNGGLHRKFMALVQFVADNHPAIHTPEQCLRELKYRTGHFTEYVTSRGAIIYEMKSISWRDMDEVEFAAWVGKAREVVFSQFFPDIPPGRIEAELNEWIAWT